MYGPPEMLGVLGRPRQYDDAVREALEHVATRHRHAAA